MANINQKWRKAIAVGCVHSAYACQVAMDNVIALVEDWKPDERIDLGDLHDFTALRKGAGSAEELADLTTDYDKGIEWLRRFRPTKRCRGNHDERMYRLLNDHRGKLALLAKMVVQGIAAVDEENGTEVRPYHQRRGFFKLGDTLAVHGFMAGAHALRQHAEAFGSQDGVSNVLIAHLHVPGMAVGRTPKPTAAYCVGTMVDPDKAEYALAAMNWNAWRHGAAKIEYTDTHSHIELITSPCNRGAVEYWA